MLVDILIEGRLKPSLKFLKLRLYDDDVDWVMHIDEDDDDD